MWYDEVISLHCWKYIVLFVSPLFIEVHPIRMSNPKTKLNFRVDPFQTTILLHKPCLKYSITIGPNFLCLPRFNPCTKYPHLVVGIRLTIGIRLLILQLIKDFTTKIIHLRTSEIVAIPQLASRISLSLGYLFPCALKKKPASCILEFQCYSFVHIWLSWLALSDSQQFQCPEYSRSQYKQVYPKYS